MRTSFRCSFQERFELVMKIVIIQRRKYLTTIICTLPIIITVSLLLVAAEWIRTLFVLIEQYQAAGLSWTRMAIILIGVALFSAFSGIVFKTSTMKKRYEAKR